MAFSSDIASGIVSETSIIKLSIHHCENEESKSSNIYYHTIHDILRLLLSKSDKTQVKDLKSNRT